MVKKNYRSRENEALSNVLDMPPSHQMKTKLAGSKENMQKSGV